jgi:membrane-associated phospholipid phosphatase
MDLSKYKERVTNGIAHFLGEIKDFIWGVGYFGWQIAFVYGVFVSYQYMNIGYAILFLVLFLISGFINAKVLKRIIYDLRPSNSTPFLHSEVFRKRTNGMPSGHAQQTAFALTYSYLFTRKYLVESIALFLLTIVQRYIFNNHTIPQLLVGGVFGVLLGVASYYLVQYIYIYNLPSQATENADNYEDDSIKLPSNPIRHHEKDSTNENFL